MPACRSPSSANRAGTVAIVQSPRLDVVDLVPADRRRDGALADPADRVGAGDRVVARVLVVVDEHLVWRRGPCATTSSSRPAGSAARPRGRTRARRGARRRTPSAARSGRRRASRSRPRSSASRPRRARRAPRERRGRRGARPLRSALWHRVEVDPPLVRLLDVGPARVPRVELDRRHLHRPDDAAELGHAQLVGVPVVPREGDAHRLHPVGRAPRDPLLVDLLAVDAAREAVQHARPLAQRADDPVADAHVVAGEIELRLAARGEVDPVGTRDADRPALDLEFNGIVTLRHGQKSRGTPIDPPPPPIYGHARWGSGWHRGVKHGGRALRSAPRWPRSLWRPRRPPTLRSRGPARSRSTGRTSSKRSRARRPGCASPSTTTATR